MTKLYALFSFLLILHLFVLIQYNNNLNYNNLSSVNNEFNIFRNDEEVYANFTRVKNINNLTELRKYSKYRKKGYGGHPKSYLFSYPLDKNILIFPKIIFSFIHLLIFIHCRPDEFYERYISRKCYTRIDNKIKIIYITLKSSSNEVNKKLKYESIIYKDILQFSEISSYFNLSIQTVHMLLWAKKLKFQYLLKTDIDVYINIPFISRWLNNFYTRFEYYAIGRISKTTVLRNKKYSHYVPRNIISENTYPPYLQGVGYIIPYTTVVKIIKEIEYVNPKIFIEDVFMGYIFLYCNISLIDKSEYILRDIPHNISYLINNRQKYMLIHGLFPYEIFILSK